MAKFALLISGFILIFALSPVATADPNGVAVVNRLTVDAPLEQTGNCDPNYSGACVPIASDVDCAGGSGNGPAYVQGPVTVIGTDIYELDHNHTGIGCEPK
jgi:hypothetical protein